ncbi:MAG: GH39 family glycosyl hydrolase [Propylenella sp.]
MRPAIPVTINVHADRALGAYRPIWNWFGYDEPNYTYGEHGRKLLAELAELSPVPPRIRTHNLLTSGDGVPALKWGSTNAYTEDARGGPVYDWAIMDRIFDAYVEAGVIPFIQVGFTPQALSGDPGPYRHNFSLSDPYSTITTGWAAPPKDLKKWRALVEVWARHLCDRYGRNKVAGWPWEVWNEPDGHYWTGTIPEFCALYDVTAAAIRGVLPEARIGGPHTCGAFENPKAQDFFRKFLEHCVRGNPGTPLDFVAFHAKGRPSVHGGRVRMGIRKHLKNVETNLEILREFPELAGKPVIIGESDPEGCAACSSRVYPQNAYRNGPLYGVYVVEAMMRTYELFRRFGFDLEGAVTWAFLFEGQPWFDGFRDLATNGVDKAVLNAFRMLGKLSGSWIGAESSHGLPLAKVLDAGVRETPDISAVATRDDRGVSVLVWHYHDDEAPGEPAEVTLTVHAWPEASAGLRHYRMDADHSNAFAVWQGMGSPSVVEGEDYARLEASGRLAELAPPTSLSREGDLLRFSFTLPPQGVSLIRLER